MHKRRPATSSPSQDYDQISFQPEFFAVKGKVLDDDEPLPAKPKTKTRPTRVKTYTKHPSSDERTASTQPQFRFPSIQNEQIFESKLQEASSNTKKYKQPEEQPVYSYSTIKFTSDDHKDDSFVDKTKPKGPKRSTSLSPSQLFSLEQSFGGQQFKFDTDLDDDDDDAPKYAAASGFKPSAKFAGPSKGPKTPGKLFKSTEDEFKDAEFFDFSIRPRPIIVTGPSGKFDKFKTDLGVKSLAIKAHKNKFDSQSQQQQQHHLQGGFKPSFKLRDFPNIHGSQHGSGIASPGQIKTYFDAEESIRDERIKKKLSNDPSPASKAQYAQFLRAKEDERLEKLVEEQFRLQQQKQIAQEKEAELKLQQQVLNRQKEKLKHVEKQLNSKVTRQVTRQKRRPHGNSSPRRQRNPSPINFSVSSGQSAIPLRTVTGKDGSYRVKFNVQ